LKPQDSQATTTAKLHSICWWKLVQLVKSQLISSL